MIDALLPSLLTRGSCFVSLLLGKLLFSLISIKYLLPVDLLLFHDYFSLLLQFELIFGQYLHLLVHPFIVLLFDFEHFLCLQPGFVDLEEHFSLDLFQFADPIIDQFAVPIQLFLLSNQVRPICRA